MKQEEEVDRCLSFGQRHGQCGLQVRICDFQLLDCVILQRCGSCEYSMHTLFCTGEAAFGGLLPGAYSLTLKRLGHKATFFVRLSPGAAVTLSYQSSNQQWHWSRELAHLSHKTTCW